MTTQERLTFILETCAHGSVKRLADNLGIDISIASRMKNGKLAVSEKEGLGRYLERIYRAYPQLNPAWLLTGEGEPLKADSTSVLEDRLKGIEARLNLIESEIGMKKKK